MGTLIRLNDEVSRFRSKFDKQLSLFCFRTDFEKLSLDYGAKNTYLKNCCKDLNNKIKTTDRYID